MEGWQSLAYCFRFEIGRRVTRPGVRIPRPPPILKGFTMINDKARRIIDTMIQRDIVPAEGQFEITDLMLDASVNINGELSGAVSDIRPTNRRYHKKLAGMNLLLLNEERKPKTKVLVEKRAGIKQKCGFLYILSNVAFSGYTRMQAG